MITNGNTLPIFSSGVPNVQDALSNWFTSLSIGKITKSVVNYHLKEVVSWATYQAVLQPFTTKQLQIKPEGQRVWQWETLHVKGTDSEFCLDDQVFIGVKKYRIMQKFEWSQYGYIEYQIIEDYGQEIPASISETIGNSENVGGTIGT